MFHCENCGREISDWEYYVYDHKCDYCRWVENNNETYYLPPINCLVIISLNLLISICS